MGVAAGGVDIVMLEEGRGRQHDIGHLRRIGHELLMHADEEIVAREALRAPCSISGQTTIGLVFWISSAVTGGPSPRSRLSPVRIGPMRDWSSRRVLRIENVEPLDQGLIESIERAIGCRARRRRDRARRRSPPAGR